MTYRARRGWESGIRALHAEAGSLMRLMLVTVADALALIAAAGAGDGSALAYLGALDTFRWRVEAAADDAPLCLTCDRRLGTGRVLIGLVIPARDDATACLAIGLCAACGDGYPDRAATEAAVVDALRRIMWPDLRPIPPPAGTTRRA